MSLTHPNPFEWRRNPPTPEIADWLQELSNKGKAKPAASFQPPHFKAGEASFPEATSKSGKLRAALKAHGPMACAGLAHATGISPKHVSPLLRHDIRAGKVRQRKNVTPWLYELVEGSAA